ALHQPRGRCLQFRRSLRDATLKLLVELFELPGLAIELGEDPDLGAQHLGNDRHRDVIDRPHLVGAQAIDVAQMDGGNEAGRAAPITASWKPSRLGMDMSMRMTAMSCLRRCSIASLAEAALMSPSPNSARIVS